MSRHPKPPQVVSLRVWPMRAEKVRTLRHKAMISDPFIAATYFPAKVAEVMVRGAPPFAPSPESRHGGRSKLNPPLNHTLSAPT